MQLTGRTALVTGGSRGIGRAVALALAQEGADVAVNYVSSETSAKQVVEQIHKVGRKAILAQADVADFPDTYRMAQDVLKEFGHLDILINNAGINSDKTFVKMDHASWRTIFLINPLLALPTVWITLRQVPESRNPQAGRTLDWPGALLACAGLAALVYALIAAATLFSSTFA